MARSSMSLHKTLFLYTSLIGLVALSALGVVWIITEYIRVNHEIKHLETQHIDNQKTLLKNEVDRALGFINYKQSNAEIELRETVKNRVYESYSIVENIFKQNSSIERKKLEKIILDALRPVRFLNDRGYFFVLDINGTGKLYPAEIHSEGEVLVGLRGGNGEKVITEMISLVKEKGEGFYSYSWFKPGAQGFHDKTAFVKIFKPLNWVIGTGEYVDDVVHDIQHECIEWISSIRFGREGYVFAGRYDGYSLSGPEAGKNMLDVTDVNGIKIVQELISLAKSGGGYFRYIVPEFKDVKHAPKLSYVVGLPEWQWYVGAGVYIDDIYKDIELRTRELKKSIRHSVAMIVFVLCFLVVCVFFFTGFFASRIKNNMDMFTRFFKNASSGSLLIDRESLHFIEFIELAGSANLMVEERKKAEQALLASHQSFLTILDSIDATIYVSDMSTHEILFMNKKMKEAFGGDKTGQLCYEALRDNQKICGFCTNRFLLDKNGIPEDAQVWQAENPVNGKWYIYYDRAIRWIDGRYVRLQIATDITSVKKMEGELLQARKMEAIGTLAGGIAHEFNNVLSIIIGNVELLLGDLADNEPYKKNIMSVLDASFRGRDVVRQLLSFSRKGGFEKKPVDISLIFKDFIKLFKASIPSNITISIKEDENLDVVLADPTRIHQLLINLCNNAVQAMGKKGGVLGIEFENTLIDGSNVAVPQGLKSGPYVKITVSDTGHGISDSIQDKIFEPYFTTKGVGEGTGMGLAVVDGIVRDHMGAVQISSSPGTGSVFHVYLPSSSEQIEEKARNEKVAEYDGKGRICFVDDEQSIVDMAEMMLTKMGYDVISFTDPLLVLKYFESDDSDIDLLISDMTMPGITGDLLAEKIHKINRNLPIILCTGRSDALTPDRIRESGIRVVLKKPFQMKELGRAVSENIRPETSGSNIKNHR